LGSGSRSVPGSAVAVAWDCVETALVVADVSVPATSQGESVVAATKEAELTVVAAAAAGHGVERDEGMVVST